MRHARSLSARFTAALTALVTVWCLGCSALDPLIEQMLGHASIMTCASDMDAMRTSGAAPAASSVTVGQEHAAPAVSAAQLHGESGLSCGCGTCTAPSVSSVLATASLADAPNAHQWRAPELQAPERVPLVPPPQPAL
jgi:hypothetical protein